MVAVRTVNNVKDSSKHPQDVSIFIFRGEIRHIQHKGPMKQNLVTGDEVELVGWLVRAMDDLSWLIPTTHSGNCADVLLTSKPPPTQ